MTEILDPFKPLELNEAERKVKISDAAREFIETKAWIKRASQSGDPLDMERAVTAHGQAKVEFEALVNELAPIGTLESHLSLLEEDE